MQDKIAIILINYNGMNDTLDCIESIMKSTYDNFLIYVVNNGSKDNCTILKEFDKVKLINLERNVGFGVANNIAAQRAINDGMDIIMCLNNDTIISNNTLEIMKKNLDNKSIVTCSIYYYSNPDKLWYGGGEISNYKGTFKHKEYVNNRNVTFVSGCCFMMTKSCFEKIGLFSKEYFMYYEDADFSIKAILNNITIKYITDTRIWHKVGMSIKNQIGAKDYYLTRNRLYILKK